MSDHRLKIMIHEIDKDDIFSDESSEFTREHYEFLLSRIPPDDYRAEYEGKFSAIIQTDRHELPEFGNEPEHIKKRFEISGVCVCGYSLDAHERGEGCGDYTDADDEPPEVDPAEDWKPHFADDDRDADFRENDEPEF